MNENERTQYRQYMASADLLEAGNLDGTSEHDRVVAKLQTLVPILFGIPEDQKPASKQMTDDTGTTENPTV